jgi:hypothetical protein
MLPVLQTSMQAARAPLWRRPCLPEMVIGAKPPKAADADRLHGAGSEKEPAAPSAVAR